MQIDGYIKRGAPDPRRLPGGDYVLDGIVYECDSRCRSELVVSNGHPGERRLRNVSLRIDDRVVVLGPVEQSQLALILLFANRHQRV